MQPRRPSFDQAYAAADPLPGWLTEDQARCLYAAATAVAPHGTAIEIGSHHGRSAVVLASALPPGARLVAIDPFPEDWRYGAADTEAAFRRNVAAAGVAGSVELRVASSAEVRAGWTGSAHLVYVDGKHDHWSCREDLRWSRHVVPGGLVLVHDAFSSLGVTTALLRELATTRHLRYTGRVGSLARLEVAAPSILDRLRALREVPWWLRNLIVKVCLRLRLPFLARLLRHHDSADPY